LAEWKCLETIYTQKAYIFNEFIDAIPMSYSKITPKLTQSMFSGVPQFKQFLSFLEQRDLRIFYTLIRCVHFDKTVFFYKWHKK